MNQGGGNHQRDQKGKTTVAELFNLDSTVNIFTTFSFYVLLNIGERTHWKQAVQSLNN